MEVHHGGLWYQLYPYTHGGVSFEDLMSNPWSLKAVLSPYESTGCLLFLHQGVAGDQRWRDTGVWNDPCLFFWYAIECFVCKSRTSLQDLHS